MLTEAQIAPHLRVLALAELLLERYAATAESEIWSRSGTIDKDLKELEAEIAAYRKELEECRHA